MNDSKAKLKALRLTITERQTLLARHTRKREEPLPADFSEQAVELENEETMIELDLRLGEKLKLVDRALARIEAGVYDQCANCEGEIEAGRHTALPEAVLCASCAATG
ncbi:MAG: TraR/DksA family transcriptional regulator [Proteobacteria bacterium]|nr:TraR/DksA family transcriptional regulator [Pseudomonadota bacterium]